MKRFIGVYQGRGFMGWGDTYEEVLERAKQRYELRLKQKAAGRLIWN